VSEHWSQECTMQHDQNILWENLQMMSPACPSGCRSIQHQTLKAHGYGAALPLMDTVIHSHSLVMTIHCHHRSNAKYSISSINETALRETQTLRAGCKAKPKMFATPFPGPQDGQNLISWRWSLPASTDPVWWRSMHAISSYRGNRHRPPTRCKHTHRQDR